MPAVKIATAATRCTPKARQKNRPSGCRAICDKDRLREDRRAPNHYSGFGYASQTAGSPVPPRGSTGPKRARDQYDRLEIRDNFRNIVDADWT